jgi:tetratricopeptide (TPR) repeat protein
MKRRFFLVTLFSFLILSTVVNTSVRADSFKGINDLIAQNKLVEALAQTKKGFSQSPKEVEFLASQSRIVALQGDQEKNEESKVKLYEEAERIASQAVKLNPNSAKGYIRRAVAKGKLGLFKGILESRTLVLEVRADAKKTLELTTDSDYERALANYLLGRVHINLAKKPKVIRLPLGLGWASKSKGAKFLKTAAALAPNSIPFNLNYAIWLKDNGDKPAAKALLEKIATLKVYDPADPEHKSNAKKLLSEI